MLYIKFTDVASAIDVKVNGQWEYHYGYYSHGENRKASKNNGVHEDRLRFRHRTRTQVRFIASETLSALLNFEIGDVQWGLDSGRVDADATTHVKLKHMYLDWTLPGTQVKTRSGIQPYALPWAIANNPIMDSDITGILVSTQFTPEVGLSVLYARPFDNNIANEAVNAYDEMDILAISVPIKTSSVRVTPYAMGAIIGRDSGYWGARGVGEGVTGANGTRVGRGRAHVNPADVDNHIFGYWLGAAIEVPALDPFILKFDLMAGGLETGDGDSDTFGYYLIGQFGYKFNFGELSLIAWYSSGDKEVDDRGVMPILSDDTGFTPTMMFTDGGRWRSYDCQTTDSALGTWAIGLKLDKVSFVDKLSHTFNLFYYRGTNRGDVIGNAGGANNNWNFSGGSGYLISTDWAWEINVMNEYKVSENLTLAIDFGYLDLNLSKQRANRDAVTGDFSTQIGIRYAF